MNEMITLGTSVKLGCGCSVGEIDEKTQRPLFWGRVVPKIPRVTQVNRLAAMGNPASKVGGSFKWSPAKVSPFGHTSPSLGQTAEQDIFNNMLSSIIFDAGGAAVGVISGVKLSGAWSTIGWVVGAAFFLKFMNDLSKIKVSA